MGKSGFVTVIPMKPLRLSKSRLASHLSILQRATLSLNLFRTVARAALNSPVDELWVFGGDRTVRCCTEELGGHWYDDPARDLNEALSSAFDMASERSLVPIYLPADLPFVAPDDVASLVEASDHGRKLTLAPAHRDRGTNSIVVPQDSGFKPALGLRSYEKHREHARTLGIKTAICDRPGLGLDLDTYEDMEACELREPGILSRLIR